MNHNGERNWSNELTDFGRALTSGFILGIPLLYTMEAWWLGLYLQLWHLVAFFILISILNLILAFAFGFKVKTTMSKKYLQAVNTMAVGIIGSLIVLVVLARITTETTINNGLGMILLQSIPISIGASLGNTILGKKGESREGSEKENKKAPEWIVTIKSLVATIVGIIFIAFALAVTIEIPMLTAELTYWHELAVLSLTLLIIYLVIYLTEYDPQERQPGTGGLIKGMHAMSLMVFSVVMVFTALTLFLLGRIDSTSPIDWAVSQTLILGLPAAIGGAGGRLVL